MNPLELTTAITALANTIACKLSVDQLNLLGVSPFNVIVGSSFLGFSLT